MAPVIASFEGLVLGLSFEGVVLGWGLTLLSLFLILLILVQRGRGGGLTGALGGPGGQSAFGTKAGDMFTKITSVTALIWIFLCAYTMWLYRAPTAETAEDRQRSAVSASADDESTGQRSSDALDDLMSGESDAEGGAIGDLLPSSPDSDSDEAEDSDEVPADDQTAGDEEEADANEDTAP